MAKTKKKRPLFLRLVLVLLALAVDQARIGQYRGRALVAFAPEELEASGRYQALAGGMSG